MPRMLAIVLLCGLLAACNAKPAERVGPLPLGADFGNAVRANAVMHIIDPSPMYADDGAPPLDGRRAAGAMQRYESGTVTAPEAPATSKRPN